MATANDTEPPFINGTDCQVFTLFINNVPSELEKEGIESIFVQYGEIVGTQVAKNKNGTYAYVSFAIYKDAERAIYELNRKPPLMLSVQFKDKRLQNEMNKTNDLTIVNLSSPITDHRYKYIPIDESNDVVKAIDLGRVPCTPVFQAPTYTCDDDLLYPVPCDSTIFNPYEAPGPYHSANLMYTRGTVHVSRDGRRHINCGRGYTFYKLPESNYNTAQMINKVYEKREQGYYVYASDDAEDDTGFCRICTTPTSYRCQKCSITFYCCRQCQVSDWPKHKFECQPVPPLVKRLIDRVSMQKQNGHNELINEPQIQKPIQLRRPKEQVEKQQRETFQNKNINHNIEELKSPTIVTSQENVNAVQLQNSIKNCENQVNNDCKKDLHKLQNEGKNFKAESTSFPIKESSQQHQREISNQSTNCKIQSKIDDDNIVFQPKLFLPKDTFTTVMITQMVNEGEYWVQKVDELDEIEKLVGEVTEYVNLQQRRVTPEENMRCAITWGNMWCRATIISIGNPDCKVFLQDIGTTIDIPLLEVCPLEGQIKEMPYKARHIRILNEAGPEFMNLGLGDEISIRALNVEADGTIIVQVADKPQTVEKQAEITNEMASCSINKSSSEPTLKKTIESSDAVLRAKLMNLPNVIDTLLVGQVGMLLPGAELSQGEYSVLFVPENCMKDFDILLNDLKEHCTNELNNNLDFSPKIGDFICGLCEEGDWYRGIVLGNKPTVTFAVIDEARIAMPVQCVPLPEKYLNIKVMGLTCQLEGNNKLPTPKPDILNFKVIEVSKESGGSAVITIEEPDRDFQFKGTVRKWIPRPEQKGIQPAKLNSGDEVYIVDFSNQNLLYLRTTATAENDRTTRLEQEIAKCALTRKPLTKAPVVGELVLSHYSLDDNYYRAIVKLIENNKILVMYVDYGNEETLTLNDLFELPEELKQCPSCVTMVKLKNVNSEVPLTEEATIYMQELIAGPVSLTCTFSGHPFKNGVELKTPKNENVNEQINLLLTPSYEKEKAANDKEVYTLGDLPIVKLGEIGDEIQCIVLSHLIEINTIVVAPDDAVAGEAIQVTMTEKIQKYVASTDTHYIPREAELCIAKYENLYYRALCVEPSGTPTESIVFFIDYGNRELVNHKDIRPITKDFLEFGAFGILCLISPIVSSEKLNDKVIQRIKELIPIHGYIQVKIIDLDSDGSPTIDIPSVRIKLIEENLI